MKRWTILLIAAVFTFMTLMMSACGNGQKSGQSGDVTQQSGQAQNNDNTSGGDTTDVDVGKDMKWPQDKMGDLPEPKAKITAILKDDSAGECTIAISEMSEDDAKAYAAKIKELGYVNNGVEMSDTESILINGANSTGAQASFTYNVSTKEGSIYYIAKSQTTGNTTSTDIDMTDATAWPNDFLSGVPELKGKITDAVNDNNVSCTVYLEYVDKADFEEYVKQLKQNGYSVDIDESTSVSYIDFKASNANGDSIRAYLNIVEGCNTATIEMYKATGEE